MRVIFFGSYDSARHPRVQALIDGFAAHGDEVIECNVPLSDNTQDRLNVLRQLWRLPVFAVRILSVWLRLRVEARKLPRPDLVVVGYMGHFDVHLAHRLWPHTPLALDHLIFAADTARDRGMKDGIRIRLLTMLDQWATDRADLLIMDTDEHLALLSARDRPRGVVVPVGVSRGWYHEPELRSCDRLRVIFFGLFTPLQGTEVIGQAIAALVNEPIDFTIVGNGQDYDIVRRLARSNTAVTWIDWLAIPELQRLTAMHDVCLGIFGTTAKALRVVPNKVYQGAAAGCAVVTSDTAPQRRILEKDAVLVPPGDHASLITALLRLQRDSDWLTRIRQRSYRRAERAFRPDHIVVGLRAKGLKFTERAAVTT